MILENGEVVSLRETAFILPRWRFLKLLLEDICFEQLPPSRNATFSLQLSQERLLSSQIKNTTERARELAGSSARAHAGARAESGPRVNAVIFRTFGITQNLALQSLQTNTQLG